MAHDVFVSYSSKDKTVADAVCAKLESNKVRCWIAPRDIAPGKTWAAAIVEAITSCRVFILVLSEGSNQSVQVIREVGEAVDNAIPVIPFRIENVEPSNEMRYYIKSIHWLDAMNPPLERDLNKLAKSVDALLSVGTESQPPVEATTISVPSPQKKPFSLWGVLLIGIFAIIFLGAVGVWIFPRVKMTPSPPELSETIWSEWQTLSFTSPMLNLWNISAGGNYYAIDQQSSDAFAWSTQTYTGDLVLSLDIEKMVNDQTDACIILYGDGYGSLIFCNTWDSYLLEKHTHYHDGENFLAHYYPKGDINKGVYSTNIEIIDNTATIVVNGERVIFTLFDTDEIDRDGRIGLLKPWHSPGVIFSNIRIKVPTN
jgi:hypothetical protein